MSLFGARMFMAQELFVQALPDLRIVEMEPGEGMPSSQEQPHVEHPESDAEDEEEEEGKLFVRSIQEVAVGRILHL